MLQHRFSWKHFLLLLIGAFLIASLVRFFIAQPFIIAGPSMQPSFASGDYVVLDLISYDFQKPARGDVVVFRYPLDPELFYVKRIAALPGEWINEQTGALVAASSSLPNTLKLAKDEYFVLGDNTSKSSDSREWGPLQTKFIIGKVFVRVWPL